MKLLVVADGVLDVQGIDGYDTTYLNLRFNESSDSNLMDLYESIKPALISELRNEIVALKPDVIVSVGRLEGYLWNGTVISRCFGQFNSWNTQRSNPFGKTTLKIDGEDVVLYAIESLDDWNYVA